MKLTQRLSSEIRKNTTMIVNETPMEGHTPSFLLEDLIFSLISCIQFEASLGILCDPSVT